MTQTPYRLSDLGEVFTWIDLRDFLNHVPPSGDSAVYRAMYPKSWWWEPQFDFLAAILNALQWANWQRGGGKGDKPKPVRRPREQSKRVPKSAKELEKLKTVAKKGR